MAQRRDKKGVLEVAHVKTWSEEEKSMGGPKLQHRSHDTSTKRKRRGRLREVEAEAEAEAEAEEAAKGRKAVEAEVQCCRMHKGP